ncbi:MAG: HNH endonuclease [Nocardioides sp.]|uniref:HNH endonuclease n=1 Tax=Nocardioides sp. TaxID=35761 RepID=UPI003267E1FF
METTTRSTATLPDSPAEVLAALKSEQDHRRASEVRSMRLAAHWVALHPALDPSCPDACFQSPKTLAGQGSPVIDEFCIPDVATMLGMTCDSVGSWLTDIIELRYRLPQLWAGVLAGLVTPWRARRIAQTTLGLTPEAASFVDEQTAWCANRLTPTQLSRLVDHARARYMPEELAKETEAAADRRHVTFDTDQVSFDGTLHLEADLDLPDALGLAEAVSAGAAHHLALGSTDTLDGRRATALGDLARHQLALGFDDEDPDPAPQPPTTQIVLHAHLSAHAITRLDLANSGECLTGSVEQAGGRVLTADQIAAWCGRPDVTVVVKPVIDLRDRLETGGYTPTHAIREHVIARDRTCVFPWCGRNARRCDLDHVIPYDHHHPDRGGTTSTDNLAALCRRHHRLKTHGRWSYTMTDPGVFVWTSPHGHQYLRDHTGSRPIDRADPTEPSGHPPDI